MSERTEQSRRREAADADEALIATMVDHALGANATKLEAIGERGLGHRRFYRVQVSRGPAPTLVARVDRDPGASRVAPEPPLEPLRHFLEASGLPVPHSHASDGVTGVDLLEDLGTRSLEVAVAECGSDSVEAERLYTEACGLVPRLQALRDPGDLAAFRRRLDPGLLQSKAQRFTDASLLRGLGRPATAAERQVVVDSFSWIARDVFAAAPQRLAHRDFQSTNLIVHPQDGHLVMVDVQGAFLAPPEYDLVCLLRDSYVALPDARVAALTARVRPALPDAPEPELFAQRFDLVTLVRKAKDHALFHEVAERGDRSWLQYAPLTWRYIEEAAGRTAGLDARLARLADLIASLRRPELPCAP